MCRFSLATVFAIAVVSAFTVSAPANTTTFETAPVTPLFETFIDPISEDGFTYSALSGALAVQHFGNPGHAMEADVFGGGGVLKIVSVTGVDFHFDALDFAAFDNSGTGSQTLQVQGFLRGSLVGTDQFTLDNTNVFFPKFENWTTEAADELAGKTISQLDITLNGGRFPHVHYEAIDNVRMTPIPEPGTLGLLGTGMIGLAEMVRRRFKLGKCI